LQQWIYVARHAGHRKHRRLQAQFLDGHQRATPRAQEHRTELALADDLAQMQLRVRNAAGTGTMAGERQARKGLGV